MTMPNWDDRKKAVFDWMKNHPVGPDYKSRQWRSYFRELDRFRKTSISFENIEKFAPKEPEISQWRWPGNIGMSVFSEFGTKYAKLLGTKICKMLVADGLLEKGGWANSQYRIKPEERYFLKER